MCPQIRHYLEDIRGLIRGLSGINLWINFTFPFLINTARGSAVRVLFVRHFHFPHNLRFFHTVILGRERPH